METRIDFLHWLSKKLYLTNVGLYATVITIMVLPTLFNKALGISPAIASFTTFFIVSFMRATYESLIIYEAPVKSLSLHKILVLVLVTSIIMSFISCYLKPSLGYFSIPVAIIIAMVIVNKLKAALWSSTKRPRFFHELPTKLNANRLGMYGFYGFLIGIAYTAYGKYGFNFEYVFPTAFFIGMLFEESYNLVNVYEQKFSTTSLIKIIIWSVFCAILSTVIVLLLMLKFGYSGQASTIAGVMLIKIIQPLGSLKFILKA
jgi:hypothetical protein